MKATLFFLCGLCAGLSVGCVAQRWLDEVQFSAEVKACDVKVAEVNARLTLLAECSEDLDTWMFAAKTCFAIDSLRAATLSAQAPRSLTTSRASAAHQGAPLPASRASRDSHVGRAALPQLPRSETAERNEGSHAAAGGMR